MFGSFTLAFIYTVSDVNVTESTKPANMTTNATTERTTPMPTTPTTTSNKDTKRPNSCVRLNVLLKMLLD